jgi:hypothetical protein
VKNAVIIGVFDFISNHLTLVAWVAAATGLIFFLLGVWLFARKRLLADTPAASASTPGPAIASGVATGPYTFTAPISGRNCYVSRTTVWQQSESKNAGWKKVAEETLHLPFFVEDPTGQLLVEPSGAELDLHLGLHAEYVLPSTSLKQETVPDSVHRFLARHGITLNRPTRIEERALQRQMPLFIAGTLVKNPGIEVRPPQAPADEEPRVNAGSMTAGNFAVPAVRPEVIKLSGGPAPASIREMTQQAKIAAALSRAGLSSPEGWAVASVRGKITSDEGIAIKNEPQPRPEPASESRPSPDVAKKQPVDDAETEPESAFNLTPALVLMKGRNDAPFTISCHGKPVIATPLGWHSVALVIGGTCLALTGVYLLLFGPPLL